MENDAWPFADWLRICVLRLGLSPAQFWAMSFSDWLALCRGKSGAEFGRNALENLMQNYPDLETKNAPE